MPLIHSKIPRSLIINGFPLDFFNEDQICEVTDAEVYAILVSDPNYVVIGEEPTQDDFDSTPIVLGEALVGDEIEESTAATIEQLPEIIIEEVIEQIEEPVSAPPSKKK